MPCSCFKIFAMKIFSPSRRLLLKGALSLSVLGLIAGCGGGGSGSNNDSTRARVNFTNTSATTANTSAIDLNGSRSTVDANATGIHAALSDFDEFTEFHVLLLDRRNSLSRTMNFNIFPESPDSARNPVNGDTFDLSDEEGAVEVGYFERQGNANARAWVATSGRVTVTNVTSSSYTVALTNATFRSVDSVTDGFTANGSLTLRKSDISVEMDATFHSHEAGFGNGGLDRKAPNTHVVKPNKNW